MNKEEFKISIINEVSNNLQTVLLIMKETNPFYRFTDGNYSNEAVFYHKELNQEIVFRYSVDEEKKPRVWVQFRDVEGDFAWSNVLWGDLSKEKFAPFIFVQEKIWVEQSNINMSLEFYRVNYIDGIFVKQIEGEGLLITFNTIDRKFDSDVAQFEKKIQSLRQDGYTYKYLDAYIDEDIISELKTELKTCKMTSLEKNAFAKRLKTIHVNRHVSPLYWIIAFMKKELKGS